MIVHFHVFSTGENLDLSTAELSPSLGEKSEQEYLAALSAHYQVEHYEDCYNLTGQKLKQCIINHPQSKDKVKNYF